MHVLVASRRLANECRTDGALDGELAVLPVPDLDLCDVGLFRTHPSSFVGVESQADVTVVEVVDLDVSPPVAMGHVRESLARCGPWSDGALTATAAQLTAEMLSIAQQFPVGTIMVKDGPVLHVHVPVAHRVDGRRPVCDPERGSRPSW